jgi:hypothetical protein
MIMKKLILFIFVCVCFASCGNTQSTNTEQPQSVPASGVKFAPNKRVSSLTEEEKQRAIAQKKAEMEVDVATLVSPRSLRMTILPPAIHGDITESVCEKVIMQMLRITSANGIAGINGSSPIAFAASVQPGERYATGSAPQRMIVKFDVTYYILNMQTWDVYASTSSTIQGVGESFDHATRNAVGEMKNSSNIQDMLVQAENQIITWFENNIQALSNRVSQACANGEYAYALSILNSVPEQATNCHAWVSEQIPIVSEQFKRQTAHQELAALKNAITAAHADYNPEVAAHLALLPAGSPEAQEGAKLYAAYMAQVDTERLRQIDEEERKRLEALEIQKLQMQYEYQATVKQMETDAKKAKYSQKDGPGGKLRSFFNGASAFSMVSHVLSRCLFLF